MTFGNDARVLNTITTLELESWQVYEGYTGPLGLGTLTNILHGHYGPGIESAERNGWGQWLRADDKGIGMDRTTATGTGYIGQYPPEVAAMYETVERCPDDLLLFMHHVPYTHILHSGNTVIQYVYDSHYAAASEAQQFPVWWRSLRGRIDDERYQAVLAHLEYQAGHAVVWRDAVCSWFLHMSGIHDDKGRAGYFPNRTEAESMQLEGYEVENVTPWEDASGGKAVGCGSGNKNCSASLVFTGTEGWYDINVQYFDENTGAARFQLFAAEQLISSWTAGANLPAEMPNGDTSTRERITQVRLHPNERIRIVGAPDGRDHASLDYIEITPHPDR